MTNPALPPAQDQQAQDALASRLVSANQATGGNRPQLATILAQSGITDSDMATIGGFAQATTLAVANRLAQDSGAQTTFTPAEQAALGAIKEPVQPQKTAAPAQSWLEKAVDTAGNVMSSTGSFLFNNPVMHGLESAMNWLGDAAHMPFRMLSSAIGGQDTQARDAEMQALGYDPASQVSRLAFMFNHGQGEYHSLDGIRQSDPNGSQLVDLAVRMQTDPDGYAKYKKGLAQSDPAKLQQLTQLENSPAMAKVNAAVDAQHISPGRDLAGLIFAPFGGKSESNVAFRLMSGALDAAYTWFADPTLVGGKLMAGIRAADVLGRAVEDAGMGARAMNAIAGSNPVFRAMRTGLQGTTDVPGVYAALGLAQDGSKIADTQAGRFWEGAVQTANEWADAHKAALNTSLSAPARAEAAAREGQLFNTLNQRYKAALPLVPEIVGTRVIVPDAIARWNETGGLDLKGTLDAAKARVDAGGITDEDLVQALHSGSTETTVNPRTGKPELSIVNDIGRAKPITDLAGFADHMASTNALLRLNGGLAAQQRILMPGKLSYTAMAKGLVAQTATKTAAKVFDYTNPAKLLADPSETAGTDKLMQGYAALVAGDKTAAAQAGRDAYAIQKRGTADANPLADGSSPTSKANIGLSGFDLAKRSRARWEQTIRRLTAMNPGTGLIDLTNPNSIQQVRNYARFYMTKYDADRLASSYAMGNLAQRREILNGITMQNLHASGVMQSEGGQAFADRFFADQVSQGDRKYGYGSSSQIQTEAGARDVAIVPSQLSNHVLIPSFRELHYAAGKFAVGGFASKVGLASYRSLAESNLMDRVMHAVKLGWITTAAGGLRNALEETLTAVAKGLGPTMLRGRVAFTQATQQYRQDLRDVSSTYQGWVKTYGREEAERRRVEAIGRVRTDGTADPEQIYQARLLEKAIAHKIPLAFRGIADHVNDVAMGSVLGKLLSYDKNYDVEKGVEYARELLQPELQSIIKDGVFQNKVASGDPIGDTEAMDLHHSGVMARKYGFVGSRPDGWGEVEYDGGAGTDAWAKYLGQMFNDPTSPAHVWTQTLKETGDVTAAARAVREYMDQPVMQHFVNNAEVLNTVGYNGAGWAKVHSADPAVRAQLQAQAKDEYANRLTDNLLGALSRKGPAAGPGGPLMDDPEWQQELSRLQGAHDDAKFTADQADLNHRDALNKVRNMEADLEARRSQMSVAERDQAEAALADARIHKQTASDLHVGATGSVQQTRADLSAHFEKGATPAPIEHGISPKLLTRLSKAQDWGAPDRQWLSSELTDADRPTHVIQQRWAPYNPAHAPGQMPAGYTQMLTTAYQKVAIDQINALTRNPLMTGLYAQARDNLAPYEQHLVDSGWDAEIASKTVQKMAVSQAQEEVFRHIDNPYVGTQFSTVARNFWAFERFQEDYLRRWGRTLRDNPEIIRKFQLAIHGGQSAGLVEKDSQGNLTFVYPGSALAMNVFNKAFRAMGLGDQVQIPIHGDLSSQLQFVNASLENPFGFSGTPLLNIPFHVMSSTVGADHPILMASMDKAINGQIGQGRTWWEQMLPSWANRIYGGVVSTDPASKFGSAYSNALFNAEAAGQLAAIDKNGADPTAIANFQRTLQTQVRNNLALEALFGFFLPAAPTLNENTDPAKGYQGNKADLSAHMQGLQSLKDEAQQLLKTMPYDQFKAYWQATHPHELIYNQSGAGARTVVGSPSAYVPADLTAARWMQDNAGFVHQYGGAGGLATYLIPQGQPGTPAGTFSDIAYRAELESGMRQYKPLEDVWKDIITQRGEDIYYRAKDAFDQSMGTLDQAGAYSLSKQQQQAWDGVQQSIFAGNPLVAEKFGSAGAEQRRTNQVVQLQAMLKDTSATTQKAIAGVRPGLEALLQAWTGYQQQYAQLEGNRWFVSAHKVRQLGAEYTTEMKQIQAVYPSLTGLINGVFRTPGMTSMQPTPALA